jgi:hypothetical protein
MAARQLQRPPANAGLAGDVQLCFISYALWPVRESFGGTVLS